MLNRASLQVLARLRIREAKALLGAGFYDGAYYLAGYSLECALKACVAKRTKRYDFPDKRVAQEVHVHDLAKLVKAAGVEVTLNQRMQSDLLFSVNWSIVKDWSEISRYQRYTQQSAEDLYSAIADRKHGVLPWVKTLW